MNRQLKKDKKWFKPLFEPDENEPVQKIRKIIRDSPHRGVEKNKSPTTTGIVKLPSNISHKQLMKSFAPKAVEDLAVHNKKIKEVEEWLNSVSNNNNDMLLLSGPVGCGKTITLLLLCNQYNIKVTEWITPLDIDIPIDNGQTEFREKQSKIFLDFILKAANYSSLLDNNCNKLVLVEDFPYTFTRTPSEFTEVLQQYKQRAKSPIVFICSDSYTDNKNSTLNLFTPALKDQLQIHHITFNGVSTTGLKAALKRVADIMNKLHDSLYSTPSADMIDCVVNSSAGDVRSAVLNLHFAALRGNHNMDTSIVLEKENNKSTKKKKQPSKKFSSIGKNETVSILHAVGRVLNPKVLDNGSQKFSHSPIEILEQFVSQPNSFVNFIEENYLPHFSSIDHADKAASFLSDVDLMLAEWREKMCQEYGLYTAVAGLMIANKCPVSAWNPVRGPKNMRIQYPTPYDVPLLDKDLLYKGKILVSDYQTYCKIIANT